MKKILFLLTILLLLTGCGRSNKIECTMVSPSTVTDYKFEAKYTIDRSGEYVKTITAVETYTVDNLELLTQLEAQAKAQYESYNQKYKGYVYSFNIKGNTLESKVIINYNIMDYAKYVEDNPVMSTYSKDGKFTVDGAKAMYALIGATCQ